MASESGTPSEAGTDKAARSVDAPSTPICWYCQRPIEDEPDRLCRGELVHSGCYVELRCGISIGESVER